MALPADTSHFTASTHRVWIPGAGHFAHFTPRPVLDRCLKRRAVRRAGGTWPTPTLPVGYTTVDNAIVPILGNDQYGDCGPCMGAHTDSVLQFRATGKASVFDKAALVSQYLTDSGGDNGTDEPEMTGPIWGAPNGIAGATPAGAILDDHLDIATDPATVQGAIAKQGFVCMAFNVPNAWINNFNAAGGAVWDGGVVGNPMNGHFVTLVGVDAQGRYILLTWGAWVYLTPAGMQANNVSPSLFTGFTRRAFSPTTGLDFNGQTYQAASAFWASMGGNPPAWPYGPVTPPAPTPTPGPTPTPPVPPPPTPPPTPPPVPPVPPVPPAPSPTPTPTPGSGWSGTVTYVDGVMTGVQPGSASGSSGVSSLIVDFGNQTVTAGNSRPVR